MLENPARFVILVAEDETGDRVGYLEASIREDIAEGCEIQRIGYVEGWYVIPSQRRKGAGRALMRAAEQWTLTKGLTVLGSDTDLDRKDSQKVHEALGFAEVDRLIAYRKRIES
jgi:aminoglycoside 6'-N-acetyltransferase I